MAQPPDSTKWHDADAPMAQPSIPKWLHSAIILVGIFIVLALFASLTAQSWRPIVSMTWDAKVQVLNLLKQDAHAPSSIEVHRLDVIDKGGHIHIDVTYWETNGQGLRLKQWREFKYSKDRRSASASS